ncbi:hypothetical protein GRI97_10115 [Altererythrobacter xixiisoli]|uniref:WG repeat-containing protein n=1 Tax=Croceibacterium xixiisoli TaxID=1476466 RepID=A0A6I4TTW4_9SPHN|nr:WG repeat-containing protein [Croceibacterium xixiisoli]MXO99344.1 hypothetical protein [Croceibacterium xixiisoli]
MRKSIATIVSAFALALGSANGAHARSQVQSEIQSEIRLNERVPLFGFVDQSGRIVQAPVFEEAPTEFSGDWVAVRKSGKWGFINLRSGEETGWNFDKVRSAGQRELFVHGPEPVAVGDAWGFVNAEGRMAAEPQFALADPFGVDGLARVGRADPADGTMRYGFVDRSGRIVVPPIYTDAMPFSAGMAVVKIDGKSGAVDTQGRQIIATTFSIIGNFADNGLAPARSDGQSPFGYIGRDGAFRIPAQFYFAGSFTPSETLGGMDAPDGLARVGLPDGRTGYIDAAGQVKARFPADMTARGISPNGMVLIESRDSNMYGYADQSGRLVIAPRFTGAGAFAANGLARVRTNNRQGYIAADGAWADHAPQPPPNRGPVQTLLQVEAEGSQYLIEAGAAADGGTAVVTRFDPQPAGFATFKYYAPPLVLDARNFGAWQLEVALPAVPMETTPMWRRVKGVIELKLQTTDQVEWKIATTGDVLSARAEFRNGDLARNFWFFSSPSVPNNAHDFIVQLETDFRAYMRKVEASPNSTLVPSTDQQERAIAALKATEADLAEALPPTSKHIAELFGTLTGVEQRPPDPARAPHSYCGENGVCRAFGPDY